MLEIALWLKKGSVENVTLPPSLCGRRSGAFASSVNGSGQGRDH
jgi:hypothetical protein